MKIDEKTGLVLEGGGMRGIFTIGVLDAFLEAGVRFPYVVAVSAGACNACSYVTEQKGRAKYSNVGMVEKYGHNYLGVRMLLKTGNIFNVPLLYDDLPNKIWPFEYDKFFNTDIVCESVVTNLRTGKAEYFSNHESEFYSEDIKASHKYAMDIILASSSLPYVSHKVYLRGVPMLDGGIVDSIPVERAQLQGYEKNVVVLTRNKGYRKVLKHGLILDGLSSALRYSMYPGYPAFREALSHRGEVYNKQLEMVEKLEEEGKILVIRPENPMQVDRIERNTDKLNALYDEGLSIGRRFCKEHFPG